jgi:hypothetical protein
LREPRECTDIDLAKQSERCLDVSLQQNELQKAELLIFFMFEIENYSSFYGVLVILHVFQSCYQHVRVHALFYYNSNSTIVPLI